MPAVSIFERNQRAWNVQSDAGEVWSIPVSREELSLYREGKKRIRLSPRADAPAGWLDGVAGSGVLCLAGGGGQQGPMLAALGASVTVLDASESQLAKDRLVAERDDMALTTVLGDMADLPFGDESFDIIVNPASTMFVPDVRPVWGEAFRVLVPGGRLATGVMNPMAFAFGKDALDDDAHPKLQHPVPYSAAEQLSDEEIETRTAAGQPLEFGHGLGDLLGGQTDAGFHIVGFYEDSWGEEFEIAGDHMFPQYIVTLAQKPAGSSREMAT